MDKFRSFAIKALTTSICITAAFFHEGSFRLSLSAALLLAVSFDMAVLLYFQMKRLEYRRRFLRKTYDPRNRVLTGLVLCEVLCLVPFYYLSGYWKTMLVNITLVSSFSALPMLNSSGRRTIQLERNEEFFKIGFLRVEHVENGDVCLNKGEVVQILDHSGGNTTVRKSDGRVFTIEESYIDDGIDIVL
ncbi:hypothetical protein [Encephalitozoon cuniculi GB-M1]|uniref:Uncharacterized protein n=2 Tax=Encephalitozoon cuniculi TaxID=6035 RepID=Q8SWD9_ENCCU|nr:uncharacterized protein ECU02_0600 [Encephalitozoon cuniculi GB-M1]AGE95603.1 hypothetical protein ECU02_0600 [Encephalitozoon cuniculi]KMV66580.1 hypothetical protein M970_020560 [Encephalitozoon cuniculi EcunIII-L]UYI28251.1 hypothetical protein J0A71_10g21550 [Encephalitozoon cuniculi]CAD25091.1 hypothetical protein [Encephalitozoon cuniculi GB-M1]